MKKIGQSQAMWQCKWCQLSTKLANNASSATWWLNLQMEQMAPSGDQICINMYNGDFLRYVQAWTSQTEHSVNNVCIVQWQFCLEFSINSLQNVFKKILLVWADGIIFEIRGQYWEQLCLVGGPRRTVVAPVEPWRGQGLIWQTSLLTHFHPRAR